MPIRRTPDCPAPGRPAGVPAATVARLPLYHRVLDRLEQRGVACVSSETLAEQAGVTSALLRKDLSLLGPCGTRGVGYEVPVLIARIGEALGLSHRWPVVIVGAGSLGHALGAYRGFEARGFDVVGMFDTDPDRVGSLAGPVGQVLHLDDLERVVRRDSVRIAVIATPADQSQGVCDRLVRAGVTSILNFAPTTLSAPAGVEIRDVDLALELHILAYHEQHRSAVAADETIGERVS